MQQADFETPLMTSTPLPLVSNQESLFFILLCASGDADCCSPAALSLQACVPFVALVLLGLLLSAAYSIARTKLLNATPDALQQLV